MINAPAHTPASVVDAPAIDARVSAHPARPARADGTSSQILSALRTDEILTNNWWGMLATAVYGRPYAVPVGYGWNGTHVFIASLDGRKIRNLQANPNACLTVANVVSGADWNSVIVEGPVEWVKSPGQILIAFHALATQGGRPFVAPPPSRLINARVLRIVPTVMAGRGRGG